jgi:hypothetical protein
MASRSAGDAHCDKNRTDWALHQRNTQTRIHEKNMHEVCDILEQLVREGTLIRYAIGGATAAGFHGEPLATREDGFPFDATPMMA